MGKYNTKVEKNHPIHLGSNKVGAKVKSCRYCQGVLEYEEEINWDVLEKMNLLKLKPKDYVIFCIIYAIIGTYLLSIENPAKTKKLAESYFQKFKQIFKKYEEENELDYSKEN